LFDQPVTISASIPIEQMGYDEHHVASVALIEAIDDRL
jgi:hypothetical protein